MDNTALHPLSYLKIKNLIFDLIAILAIYLVPAISHLFSFPVYYLEPMRIMLVLAIVHTSRKNAYLIALTPPLFSLLVSAHPSIIKSSLITGELLVNVWLFFLLSEKISNKMLSMLLSITVSKIFYYVLKFLLINSVIMNGNLFSTPVYIQIVMLFLLSGYVYLISYRRRDSL
jgi:hypothetical protein